MVCVLYSRFIIKLYGNIQEIVYKKNIRMKNINKGSYIQEAT